MVVLSKQNSIEYCKIDVEKYGLCAQIGLRRINGRVNIEIFLG
jgi:hypothetical protein